MYNYCKIKIKIHQILKVKCVTTRMDLRISLFSIHIDISNTPYNIISARGISMYHTITLLIYYYYHWILIYYNYVLGIYYYNTVTYSYILIFIYDIEMHSNG